MQPQYLPGARAGAADHAGHAGRFKPLQVLLREIDPL